MSTNQNKLKSYEDIVNWTYDSSIEQFGEPVEFDYYDRNVLFSHDEIKQDLKNYSDLGITEKHFDLYIKNGLLPELYMEDGKRGFPNYTSTRIEFIYNLINKWGYDFKRLKKITSYEEMLIELYIKDEFEYGVSFLSDGNDMIKNKIQKNLTIRAT